MTTRPLRKLAFLTFSLSAVFLLTGCQTQPQNTGELITEGITIPAASPEETVKNWYRYNLQQTAYPVVLDESVYDRQNSDEILRTLEVVEVDSMGDRAAVFLRWSVGTKVFRDAQMLRKVGDVWTLTNDRQTYFSEYNEDEWSQDSVALFDKRLVDWQKESPERFE